MHYSANRTSVYAPSCSSAASLLVQNIKLAPKSIVCLLTGTQRLCQPCAKVALLICGWSPLPLLPSGLHCSLPPRNACDLLHAGVCVCVRVVDNRHCASHFWILLKCRNGSHRHGHLFIYKKKKKKSIQTKKDGVKVNGAFLCTLEKLYSKILSQITF